MSEKDLNDSEVEEKVSNQDQVDETNENKETSGSGEEFEEVEVLPQEEDEVIEVSKKEYEKYKKDVNEYHDKMMRALAELENFRKRSQKDREQYLKFANERVIKDIIDIYDNFERALFHIDEKKEKGNIDTIIEGIKMIKQQLFNILEKNGVEKIAGEVGEEFDPSIQEAVQVIDSEESDNKVVQVLQNGYKMYDKVIKSSMVAVSKLKES